MTSVTAGLSRRHGCQGCRLCRPRWPVKQVSVSAPLMPFIPSYADYAAERWQRRKAPIYGAFSLAENAADSALYFAEFQQNAEAEFLHPYMGLFWSGATAFFSKSFRPMTRLLKNDYPSRSLLNFSNLRNFSKMGTLPAPACPVVCRRSPWNEHTGSGV